MAEENRVVVLVDYENILMNIPIGSPGEGLSVTQGLTKIVEDISRQVGKIIGVFVFAPTHLAIEWGETLHELGFYIISCPRTRVRNEENLFQDTTDCTLIRFGRMMINEIKGLTHFVLGSGDKDFAPLIRQALEKGLMPIVVVGSYESLAGELADLSQTVLILPQSQIR